LVRILSHINPVHTTPLLPPISLRSILISTQPSNTGYGGGGGVKRPGCAADHSPTTSAESKFTLRPTVSRQVRLGVLPLLEQVTRCYIYLTGNYFLYFSCRAPSQTRGRICNLQCNDASSVSSYIATDGLSASSAWCRAPGSLTHNPMNRVKKTCIYRSLQHTS
jgi:hypothetical protein